MIDDGSTPLSAALVQPRRHQVGGLASLIAEIAEVTASPGTFVISAPADQHPPDMMALARACAKLTAPSGYGGSACKHWHGSPGKTTKAWRKRRAKNLLAKSSRKGNRR